MSKANRQLDRRTSEPHCAVCGRRLNCCVGQPASSHQPLCSACCEHARNTAGHANDEKVFAALRERAAAGRRLGNDHAIEYPDGMDYQLKCLLDDLRSVQIKVRITLLPPIDSGGSGSEVHDGHLRRITHPREADHADYWEGSLGLFHSPTDASARWALDEGDYDRLMDVTCIDRLLIGNGPPRRLWNAPPRIRDERSHRCHAGLIGERKMAIWLAIHILIVLVVIVALAVPFCIAVVRGDAVQGVAWGLTWWLVGTVFGSTIGFWETWPDLSLLFSSDDAKADSER